MNLENKIEAILFFKNEPVTLKELLKILSISLEKLQITINKLQTEYRGRGIVVVLDGESVSLGTHPDASELIQHLQKEELSRELGRAGLETLAIVLYKGPVSRREIDHVRGVNSSFILRILLIRGLVERLEGSGRGYSYKATLELLRYLGITRREDLPEFDTAFKKIEEFVKSSPTETDE